MDYTPTNHTLRLDFFDLLSLTLISMFYSAEKISELNDFLEISNRNKFTDINYLLKIKLQYEKFCHLYCQINNVDPFLEHIFRQKAETFWEIVMEISKMKNLNITEKINFLLKIYKPKHYVLEFIKSYGWNVFFKFLELYCSNALFRSKHRHKLWAAFIAWLLAYILWLYEIQEKYWKYILRRVRIILLTIFLMKANWDFTLTHRPNIPFYSYKHPVRIRKSRSLRRKWDEFKPKTTIDAPVMFKNWPIPLRQAESQKNLPLIKNPEPQYELYIFYPQLLKNLKKVSIN